MFKKKRICWIGCLFLLCAAIQAKAPVLKDIIDGKYNEKEITELCPMSDGEHYTQKSEDGKLIVRYAYRTGKPVDTLFNTATARECPFKTFDGYSLSEDEKRILVYTDKEPIYRRSFKAEYYTFEIKRNLVKPLSKNGKQQVPLYSPNGRMVAFVRDNNIYLKKLDYDTESVVTKDGELNKISNGVPDWVYEEEFATTSSLAWSPDNETLAFIKYNETNVPQYSIQLFEGKCPELTQYASYPGEFTYKYPVAGAANAVVGVYVYTVESRAVKKADVPIDADGYIPRIRFTRNPEQLAVMTLNRQQNLFKMYATNPRSGVSKLLVQDQNKCWIDPGVLDQITFYDQSFVFMSDKDGYRQLYQYSPTGALIKQVTRGKWDVTDYLGYDPVSGSFYYEAATEGPLFRSVYKIDAKGNSTRLSERKGTNKARFSANFNYYVNRYSSAETPLIVTVNDRQGKQLRVLQDNAALKQKLAGVDVSRKEFFTFSNEAGMELNGYMLKPIGFDAARKYPVVMVQYSGPGSQEVLDKWSYDWKQVLTSQGFVVACVDGRGTGGRGDAFEKSIYLKMGVLEARDQIAAARYLASLGYVDGKNIAIWGWSFGGYTTLMSMTLGQNVFKAGIAIAPVTDWKYYDSIYTERYMRSPKENADGYAETSPLLLAHKLSGNLLIISGTADDNVHYLNTLQYSEALVQANKQFDMQVYTNRNHNISGCNTRLHLFTKVCDFFEKQLK